MIGMTYEQYKSIVKWHFACHGKTIDCDDEIRRLFDEGLSLEEAIKELEASI